LRALALATSSSFRALLSSWEEGDLDAAGGDDDDEGPLEMVAERRGF
jgi:hypothetical protein